MMKIKKSEVRIICQETFKGYGKGLSLLRLVSKGIKLHMNGAYFVLVLFIRGSASALFKACILSILLKKPVKTNKAKLNYLFITIPSVFLFLIKSILARYMDYIRWAVSDEKIVE
jgi:hypothetical protein